MNNYRLIFFTFFICVFYIFPCLNIHAEQKKNVLIINSYHQGYKWTDEEVRGIISGVGSQKEDIQFFIEYMGTKWMFDEQYLDQLRDLYKRRFSNIKFDLIMATDNDAFQLVRKYRDDMFGNTPVVFCGVNWFKKEDVQGVASFTGVNEDASIEDNIDLMLKLHPKTKHIYVVADLTTTGKIIHAKVEQLMPKYKGRFELHWLDDMDTSQIVDVVSRLSSDSLVYLTLFQKDRSGNFLEFSEIAQILSRNAHGPVYGLWDFHLGYGIVGGMLTSGYAQGEAAGKIALRVLRGESAGVIPVVMKSPNRFMFDYQQLKRFEINLSDLPEESLFINEPVSFYSVNKRLVWVVSSGLLILSVVVVFLLFNIRLRKQAEVLLKKSCDEVEKKVMERTDQLSKLNMDMEDEIRLHKQAQELLKKAYDELRNMQSQLLQSEKMATVGQLAAGVAHEINNPAGFVKSNLVYQSSYIGKLEVMVKKYEQAVLLLKESGTEQASVMVQDIERFQHEEGVQLFLADFSRMTQETMDGVDRIARIVKDLMGFAHADAGGLVQVDIHDVIQSALKAVKNEFEFKVEVVQDFAFLRPVFCSPQLLSQVFLNLFVNALQAVSDKGKIIIKTFMDNGMVVVRISDTGCGMSEDVCRRVFEPFFTTKPVGKGTGLGLSLVYEIVKKHGGDITVESRPGEGATFTIFLPVKAGV
ncbi:MAG: ABC transporter substrate binding protein [Candidatus Omnitrophota bacterium]